MGQIIIRKITADEVASAMALTPEALTLDPSPYGLPFYLAIGFVPTGDEQEINGIRSTSMKYVIPDQGAIRR